MPVLFKVASETALEFGIFEAHHESSRDDRKGSQTKADEQPGPNAPSDHLAQMSQVDWMPDSTANSRRNQPPVCVHPTNFRDST